jgi:hypothetical protein
MAIPKRTADRIQAGLKQLVSVINAQKARDVSEADTVTLVKDLLSEVFGFDKYAELTSEHSIRGTYCDLAIKIDGKLAILLEVKAIGLELKESHIKQAVDYAANQGIEWVVLTNAATWMLFHVTFTKPIDRHEVASFDLLKVNVRSEEDLGKLYLLTREGLSKNALAEYRDRQDATSRYMLSAIILSAESVRSAIRREIRRISDLLVDEESIVKTLREDVIKREVVEGDLFQQAVRRVNRAASERAARKQTDEDESPTAPSTTAPTPPQPR